MNFGIIFTTLGWVLVTEGICMLLPLICALVYSESALLVFACCILLCIIAGFALTRIPLKCKSMYAKEGFITVALSWIVISLFGSLPSFSVYRANAGSFPRIDVVFHRKGQISPPRSRYMERYFGCSFFTTFFLREKESGGKKSAHKRGRR